MRTPLLAAAAAAAVAVFAAAGPGQQPGKKADKNKFAPPAATRPDDATLKTITDKTAQLREAVAGLKAKKTPDDVLIEVEVYLRAAENIVRFEEWFHKDSGKWALTTLDRGLERATQAEGGKAPWRDETGRWVARAYRSMIDKSIQPYAVLLPADYGSDAKKKWRLDIVLHGRDGALTEAKFLALHDKAKLAPKDLGFVQLEVYGRGNNAYRWAGEQDVWEAEFDFNPDSPRQKREPVDASRRVLRGFSMGGAGTWHIGLHRPYQFCVIGPGAGFTTTHGYIGGLPNPLPEYQEKCLRIYDAARYAENAFNVPVVAYSGEKDGQKKAADNIENALKDFPEKLRFTHIVAPGLEHAQPPEWQAKCEAEYRKYADTGRTVPDRVRFVTYTPRYGRCDWARIDSLERTYERAVIDLRREGNTFTGTTTNVRRLELIAADATRAYWVRIDGANLTLPPGRALELVKVDGRWEPARKTPDRPQKRAFSQGPIDDAFLYSFEVTAPSAAGWHAATDRHAKAADAGFARLWDRYFRGPLPRPGTHKGEPNEVLFGDPASNPKIAAVLPKLPITWTKEKLVVNGAEYDAATHLPVLIYPHPSGERYVVLNSGHTFGEADLKGTNALLYPRLGDWAVIRPAPTPRDPAAYEVVAAGLFDENWQFPKK
ncbi:hypothetical protein [Urbifossiella limnaea]|uniref:Peptidase S9 prolyl oligopeptidase catalytic domain-containing protein n=1 Tax=Urbifossiella limnaea TaxID=2528023 RepID=A0A517Y0Y7_9BACT|nr:hypothetical protein [Urbifossiella limnaea]QDU23426.1 hypothetical protein ETAA1_54260 [Urbifossiella limnaea]